MFQLILFTASDDSAAIASKVIFLLLCVIALNIYFLPTVIASHRKHPNRIPIFLVNFLLGWLCLGWIVALVWSATAIDKDKSDR